MSMEPTCVKNTFESLNGSVIEKRQLSDLKTDPNHPRKTTVKQAEKSAALIRALSWVPPILIDQNNIVVVGQEWVDGAKLLGIDTIQVLAANTLNEQQIRLFRIAHARILEEGHWDKRSLAAEFSYLIEAKMTCDLNFSVELTGFETAEIDIILDDQGDGGDSDTDDIVLDLENAPVSKVDDLWILGKHRILCGNSLNPDSYRRLLDGKRCQLLCTDPPFNVKIDGHVSGKGAIKHKEFSMASGELSSTEFEEFLYRAITNAVEHLNDGACSYLFMDWRHDQELQAAARRCKLTQLNLCIWDKSVGGMGSFYRSQHELIYVYRKGTQSHKNNIMLGKYSFR